MRGRKRLRKKRARAFLRRLTSDQRYQLQIRTDFEYTISRPSLIMSLYGPGNVLEPAEARRAWMLAYHAFKCMFT